MEMYYSLFNFTLINDIIWLIYGDYDLNLSLDDLFLGYKVFHRSSIYECIIK